MPQSDCACAVRTADCRRRCRQVQSCTMSTRLQLDRHGHPSAGVVAVVVRASCHVIARAMHPERRDFPGPDRGGIRLSHFKPYAHSSHIEQPLSSNRHDLQARPSCSRSVDSQEGDRLSSRRSTHIRSFSPVLFPGARIGHQRAVVIRLYQDFVAQCTRRAASSSMVANHISICSFL